jgi:hypothetical protein
MIHELQIQQYRQDAALDTPAPNEGKENTASQNIFDSPFLFTKDRVPSAAIMKGDALNEIEMSDIFEATRSMYKKECMKCRV